MPAQNPVDAAVYDLVTTAIGNPAGGANFVMAVPDNARIQILDVGFIFTTDATVTNRNPVIVGATPAQDMIDGASSIAQTASNVYRWHFVAGLPAEVDLTAFNIVLVPLSPNLILEPGDSLESLIMGIQPGDAVNAIATRYKQWTIA